MLLTYRIDLYSQQPDQSAWFAQIETRRPSGAYKLQQTKPTMTVEAAIADAHELIQADQQMKPDSSRRK